MARYNPADIELKWQKIWADEQIHVAHDFDDKPKFVMLAEFPYPSGAGLHMGHMREYTLGDIIARWHRMRGKNVLFPMGFDAFGLPTENYAIKKGITPQAATADNIATFRRQMDMMGYSIDWNRSFSTTDPEYYRWTQWLFLQFFKKGLAYQDEIAINWCPFCKTGLANEEVVNGRHERCENLVEKKVLKQWVLRITDYAERLIDGLTNVDYPSRIADQQINWVGKSVGAEVDFQVDGSKDKITVFTTRPDTIFGATFMVLAPEHPLVAEITTAERKDEVETYIRAAQGKSEIERQETDREKTGVFTGAYAINPANGEKIPIWIADYVLMGYGTGAIMAVPAHDERDYEFAQKFNIRITPVISPSFGEAHEDEVDVQGTVIVGYNPKTNKYLGLRTGTGGVKVWLPGGGLEKCESFEECARREFKEETGYAPKCFVQLGVPIFSHYFNPKKQSHRRSFAPHFVAIVDKKADAAAREAHEDFDTDWFDFDELYDKIAEYGSDTEHWLYILNMTRRFVENGLELSVGDAVYSDEGTMINSGEFDGLSSSDAREKITQWLAKKGAAHEKINYKLRDWIFSLQRYWGEPIPIIHCEKHGAVAVSDDQLPVELPPVEKYEPTDDGESPLSRVESWVNTTCPQCGGPAKRETDTMPNWAGSNWYYLRYFDAHNNKAFADPKKLKYWGMVDLYLGGMEHTTLHLLYSRFHHQFLYDQGLIPTPEPYASRRGQGIVLAADGRKMSKSLNNVVDPTKVIESGYGADAARMAITFLAPYDQTTPWSPESVAGCYRFLGRVWNFAQAVDTDKSSKSAKKILHRVIKKVSEDLEHMNYNTAIAALMETLNDLGKIVDEVGRDIVAVFVQLLAPFAPHLAEEIWREKLGEKSSIHTSDWPTWDEKYLTTDQMIIAIQVNGKLRGEITVAADASEDEIKTAALAVENVQSFVGNKKPARVIYVPGRIVNIVVKG